MGIYHYITPIGYVLATYPQSQSLANKGIQAPGAVFQVFLQIPDGTHASSMLLCTMSLNEFNPETQPQLKTIKVEWPGEERAPEAIEIDGVKRKVNYMRDGVIVFEGETTAKYKRLSDNSMLLTYHSYSSEGNVEPKEFSAN